VPPVDRLRGRRWRWLRLTLTVHDRYKELHGGELASAITLAAFLSLLPLLLVGIAVLGFFSAASSEDLPARVISELGLSESGKTAQLIDEAVGVAEDSRRAASLVGLAGLLWTGLGLVNALQYAWDTAWQVRGRGLRDRLVGLGWLAGAGLLFAASFALSAGSQWLPWFLSPLGVLAGFGTGVALWLWTSKVLPNRHVPWRALLPSAIVGAAGFEVLKIVGSYWVPRAVASSSALYGSIGVVFAILAWLLVFGRLVAYTTMLEVILWEERHGTVRLTIEVPAQPGVAPVAATRAGEQKFGSADGGRGLSWSPLRSRGARDPSREPTGPGRG
jgi:membrane protein